MVPRLLYHAPKAWPRHIAELFLPLGPERWAPQFVRTAPRIPLARTCLHRALCCLPLDDFDINARLDTYPLHLFSADQFGKLFSSAGIETPLPRVLDVGAGAGFVTKHLHPYCQTLVATETSGGMARRLRASGYTVWQEDVSETAPSRAADGLGSFSLVTVFNILDRCASPVSLLKAAHTLLGPAPSWLLLATPLPFHGAYFGWRTFWSGRPLEPFELGGGDGADDWAAQAVKLLEEVLPAAGFEPALVSRLPYLCGGDAFVPFSELDDLVVLARKV